MVLATPVTPVRTSEVASTRVRMSAAESILDQDSRESVRADRASDQADEQQALDLGNRELVVGVRPLDPADDRQVVPNQALPNDQSWSRKLRQKVGRLSEMRKARPQTDTIICRTDTFSTNANMQIIKYS